jgi:hypothetical protein
MAPSGSCSAHRRRIAASALRRSASESNLSRKSKASCGEFLAQPSIALSMIEVREVPGGNLTAHSIASAGATVAHSEKTVDRRRVRITDTGRDKEQSTAASGSVPAHRPKRGSSNPSPSLGSGRVRNSRTTPGMSELGMDCARRFRSGITDSGLLYLRMCRTSASSSSGVSLCPANGRGVPWGSAPTVGARSEASIWVGVPEGKSI